MTETRDHSSTQEKGGFHSWAESLYYLTSFLLSHSSRLLGCLYRAINHESSWYLKSHYIPEFLILFWVVNNIVRLCCSQERSPSTLYCSFSFLIWIFVTPKGLHLDESRTQISRRPLSIYKKKKMYHQINFKAFEFQSISYCPAGAFSQTLTCVGQPNHKSFENELDPLFLLYSKGFLFAPNQHRSITWTIKRWFFFSNFLFKLRHTHKKDYVFLNEKRESGPQPQLHKTNRLYRKIYFFLVGRHCLEHQQLCFTQVIPIATI